MTKPLTTEEKIVLAAILGACVAALLLFGLNKAGFNPFGLFQDRGFQDRGTSGLTHTPGSASDQSPSAHGDDKVAKITELENQVQSLKAASPNAEKIAGLEAQLESERRQAQALAGNSEKTIKELKARLAKISGSSASTELGVAGSAQFSELTEKLGLAEAKNEELDAQLNTLSSSAKGENSALSDKLTELQSENQKLSAQLAEMKAAPPVKITPNVDQDTASKMSALMETKSAQETQIAKQRSQISELSAQVNQLKAAKNIFVESTDDLPEKAKGLFNDLQSLEGKPEAEVQAAYRDYLSKHGATTKKRIKFASGSSALTSRDREAIAALTQAADKNTYFLIVGYADQAGSAASNRKLSSARSTSVAKELASKAKGFQSAQAVYLGQTERFGASSENRVVEIWEIQ